MTSHFCENLKKNIHCHCVTLLTFKLLIEPRAWGQIRKFLYLCLWNIYRHWYENNEAYTPLCRIVSGYRDLSAVCGPELCCVISLTNIVITRAPGSLTRPLIGQFVIRSPLIGWCWPHLCQGIVITFGHRSHRRNHYIVSSAQLSACWNVEYIRSIWVCTEAKTCGDTNPISPRTKSYWKSCYMENKLQTTNRHE